MPPHNNGGPQAAGTRIAANRRCGWWKALALVILVFGASPTFAQQPLAALRQQISAGMRILNDPGYRHGTPRRRQLQKLREIARNIFDFREFSRRVLASRWKHFAPQQKNEFVTVFSEFLEKFYLTQLQTRYRDEQVRYLGQQMISNSKALVNIKVIWQNMEIPLTLRMTRRSGSWKVYDISVLGISAVRIYRAQFKAVLRKQSPGQVIARLKKKLAALNSRSF